jgi:hypothetical protein
MADPARSLASFDVSAMSRSARHALLSSPNVHLQVLASTAPNTPSTLHTFKLPVAMLTAFSPLAARYYSARYPTTDLRITEPHLTLSAVTAIINWMTNACDTLTIEPIWLRGWVGGNLELYFAARALNVPLVRDRVAVELAIVATERVGEFLDERSGLLAVLPREDLLVPLVAEGFKMVVGNMAEDEVSRLVARFPRVAMEMRPGEVETESLCQGRLSLVKEFHGRKSSVKETQGRKSPVKVPQGRKSPVKPPQGESFGLTKEMAPKVRVPPREPPEVLPPWDASAAIKGTSAEVSPAGESLGGPKAPLPGTSTRSPLRAPGGQLVQVLQGQSKRVRWGEAGRVSLEEGERALPRDPQGEPPKQAQTDTKEPLPKLSTCAFELFIMAIFMALASGLPSWAMRGIWASGSLDGILAPVSVAAKEWLVEILDNLVSFYKGQGT